MYWAHYNHYPDSGALTLIALGVGGGMAASSLLAKPKTPKLPEPVPLPKTEDIEKRKGLEKRQMQKRQTKTLMTSGWLKEPSLLSRQLGG